jgi:hypothetical protein
MFVGPGPINESFEILLVFYNLTRDARYQLPDTGLRGILFSSGVDSLLYPALGIRNPVSI